jgi:hypothetical protein
VTTPFLPTVALGVLVEHGVDFVLIGGLAMRMHGSPIVTNDLDICYGRDEENRERLAQALVDLEARLRGPNLPTDLPFVIDADTFRDGGHYTLSTRAGDLDVLGFPSGSEGYEDLRKTAVTVEIDAGAILVAAIDDLVRMKRAAGRRKDLLMLEELAALRDRLDERGERG